MTSLRNFICIVGSPGSGKTYSTVSLIKNYKQNVIIVKHTSNINDAAHSFLSEKNVSNIRQCNKPGAFYKCKIGIAEKKEYLEFLDWVKNNYRNGLLIIDDCTIFERDRLSLQMNNLVAMRRHYGIDIILIYHGLSLFPIEQYIFLNKLIVFNTNDNVEYKIKKIPKGNEVLAAIQQAKANHNNKNVKIKYKPVVLNLSSL